MDARPFKLQNLGLSFIYHMTWEDFQRVYQLQRSFIFHILKSGQDILQNLCYMEAKIYIYIIEGHKGE